MDVEGGSSVCGRNALSGELASWAGNGHPNRTPASFVTVRWIEHGLVQKLATLSVMVIVHIRRHLDEDVPARCRDFHQRQHTILSLYPREDRKPQS